MYIDLENFQKVYYEKVKPLEEEFENDKVTVRMKMAIIIIIAIAIEFFLYAAVISSNTESTKLFIYVIVIAAFLCGAVIRNFTNKAKRTIFPTLFKSIDSNLIYDDVMRISRDKFIDSNLFTSSNCSYSPQDCLSTKIFDKDVKMCELEVQTGSGKNRHTVFSGIFLNIVLDKKLQSDMKIVYNTSKDFGIIKTLFANEDKVNLENIEFENEYDVYCSDQIYARKIITLTFMEKLLYATNKLNRRIKISFKNNNIYIAISGLQLINDSALFSKKIDMMNIAREINDILTIIDTISYLDLDEKIS
ncbi:MAG: putative galanin [Clostridia bacterium]|jgi:hypothetical protein|nr:putative galanin [Clostridia bacterium]